MKGDNLLAYQSYVDYSEKITFTKISKSQYIVMGTEILKTFAGVSKSQYRSTMWELRFENENIIVIIIISKT